MLGFCECGRRAVLGPGVHMGSVSEVELGVGRVTIAVVTVCVLLDFGLQGNAFRLDRDERLLVGGRTWMSFSSSCSDSCPPEDLV